jgi:energy-coupling factor transporter ATP-binding protein EcfA2
MLKRIVLENYRSCLHTSVDLHPNLSVLIGPNGSGKTNILQGIMLLGQMARGQEHAPGLKRLTSTSRIRATFDWPHSDAELRASVDSYTNESNRDVIVNSRQKWRFETKTRRRRSFSSDFHLGAVSAHQQGFFLHDTMPAEVVQRNLYWHRHYQYQLWRQNIPKWVKSLLDGVADYSLGIRYYGASQFTNPGTCPTSFEIEREGAQRGLHRISGHARILYGMYSASRADSKSQYARFIDIVGPKGLRLIDALNFREVKTSSTEYNVRVGGKVERRRRDNLLVIPQFRIGAQTLSPNQLSEGTFKTLALLFHIITDNSTALLIEEPEVCVHHGLLASILELVRSYSSRKQMILSTHSDYVLDHVEPENVYRVTFTHAAGTVARHIRKTMTSKEFAALRNYLEREGNLGEYWREGGLGDRA